MTEQFWVGVAGGATGVFGAVAVVAGVWVAYQLGRIAMVLARGAYRTGVQITCTQKGGVA